MGLDGWRAGDLELTVEDELTGTAYEGDKGARSVLADDVHMHKLRSARFCHETSFLCRRGGHATAGTSVRRSDPRFSLS